MTRFYIVLKTSDRYAKTGRDVIIQGLSKLLEEAIKSITTDNRKEFAKEKALGCKVYFADAYCTWQKGTSENLNSKKGKPFVNKL